MQGRARCVKLLLGSCSSAAGRHRRRAAPVTASHGRVAADAREAFTATPAFGPDGTLWLVRADGRPGRGRRSRPTSARPSPSRSSVTARADQPRLGPRCAGAHRRRRQGRPGRHLRDLPGQALQRPRLLRALDATTAQASPRRSRITADTTSQRFETVGDRSRRPGLRGLARQAQRRRGSRCRQALSRRSPRLCLVGRRQATFGDTASPSTIPASAAASASPSPVPAGRRCCSATSSTGSVRDHAVVTFKDATTPGPLRRVSVDDWKIEACPHQGPSLAIAPDGSYHVAWFTDGSARKGLFYARADNGRRAFGAPRALSSPDRQPARPYLLANGHALHLVWKEFDGTKALVRWQVSPRQRPQLERGPHRRRHRRCLGSSAAGRRRVRRVYLSWLTKTEGYRLIPLEDQP